MAVEANGNGDGPRDVLRPVATAHVDSTRPAVSEVVRPDTRGTRPPVFSAELFSSLLVRERKRSERSNRPFLLLSLKANARLDPECSPIGKAALEALAATTRETDLLGWVKWPTVVGVIFLEIGDTEPAVAVETIRARVYRELEQRLGARTIGDLSLEFHVFPEPGGGDPKPDAGVINPVLHPDLIRDQRQHRFSDWIKRALDIVTSLALLVGLAPLLLLIATLVRLTSPGPALFKQPRLGEMGKPFRVFKFRTMYIDAAENPHYAFVTQFIKESGRIRTPATGQPFKLTSDPRVTPLGRLLRKTSLDELPQIWNVLRGEMSLVGPRPPIPYEVEHYAPWHRRRVLEAKPGITGLWQVMGRSRTTFDEMVRLDLTYARTRSLWTDLRILLRTPRAVLSGNGAR
jgi:lipopolysaccharide/colanic/teichoic acid biosynthesis glycosyltransferase